MTRTVKRTIVATLSLTLGAGAGVATAQSNDAGFRGWSYLQDIGAPRAAGLGGAFVGLADDASAVALNPAGMATLAKTQIAASGMDRASGKLANGDATLAKSGIGFIGGVAKLSRGFALGAYVAQPHSVDVALAPAGGATDTGYLVTTVTDVGVAAAWNVAPKLFLGARATVSHLAMSGEVVHADGRNTYAAATAAKQDRLSGDLSVLVQPNERLSVGAAFTQGSRWNATRIAEDITGRLLPVATYQVSSPSRLAAGLAVRASPRLLATVELDYLLLSRLEDTFAPMLQPARASDYVIGNALEPHAGIEVSFPLRSRASVQVRGGVYSQAPAALRFVGSAPPPAASAFPGATRKTVGTAGASLSTHSFRIDVAGSFGGERAVLVGGAAVRF